MPDNTMNNQLTTPSALEPSTHRPIRSAARLLVALFAGLIFAAGLTLLIITLLFNLLGHWLRRKYREAY